jgi:hypothetical protein
VTDSQVCPECGADVPVGRLSCRACGALLAAVPGRGTAAEQPLPEDAPLPEDSPLPADLPRPDGTPLPADAPLPADLSVGNGAGVTALGDAAGIAPLVDAPPEAAQSPMPPMPPIPGAYLPPSVIMRRVPAPAPAVAAAQEAQAARPGGSGPSPATLPPQPEPVTAPVGGGPNPGETAPAPSRGVPVLELPFAIAPGNGPRLVAVGAALGVVAFVLPWVPGGAIVIGGAFGTGYFSTWGLAAIGNMVPFLLAWLSLALAVFANRAPRYAALGLLPVALGGAFAGSGWIYLTAPTGTGIGIWALAAAACLLLAGGSLVIRTARGDA